MKADFTDLFRIVDFLERLQDGVATHQERAVMAAGLAYETDMKKSPLVPLVTGQYRSHIRTDIERTLLGPISKVGDDMPQTRRLEVGFVGADKLGRVYNQAPRPHWRPTWDFNLAKYEEVMLLELLKDVHM